MQSKRQFRNITNILYLTIHLTRSLHPVPPMQYIELQSSLKLCNKVELYRLSQNHFHIHKFSNNKYYKLSFIQHTVKCENV